MCLDHKVTDSVKYIILHSFSLIRESDFNRNEMPITYLLTNLVKENNKRIPLSSMSLHFIFTGLFSSKFFSALNLEGHKFDPPYDIENSLTKVNKGGIERDFLN